MSDRISNYLEHVDALLADPLRVARASAAAGARVVGYVGDDIPISLIAASGALPVRVRGRTGRATPRADAFMESAFSPALRALAEDWLQGELDFIGAVVFPRADDSAQRLYYYLCELQRRGRCGGPRPLLFDVARIARPASIAHSRDSTRRLAEELGVRHESLAAACERVSRRDALLAEVQARRLAPACLSGAGGWRMRQAAECDWRGSFDDATRQWLATAAAAPPTPLRIVFAGDAPPDDSLHRDVEACGGSVVLELTESLPGPESTLPATLDDIADRFQARRNPVLAMREDACWVARRASEARADGVVFWLIEEDEALPWEISRQVRALRDAGMPTLLLTRQPWIADERAHRQVRDFMTGLKGSR